MLAPRNGKIDHVAQKCGIRAVDLPPLEQGVVSRLGAKTQFVALSEQPEITIQEYALILDIVDRGREIIDAEDCSLIYVLKEEGYVAVIKATRTGMAVFMTSFRRLSSRAAQRDGEVRRLLLKATPKTID